MSRLLCAAILIAILVASPASAAWTPPTTLSNADEANPRAQAAFGGSVLTGWLKPTAALSKRLGAPSPITTADPFEQVWAGGLDAEGNAIVLTVRRHQPRRRVRAIIDGTRRTISDGTHTANAPVLAVAPDGTAVAAWSWRDSAGWLAQTAIRRPGQPRFDKPQNVSPPARERPFLVVAAGEGGRGAVGWQVSGASLHVTTAGTDAAFGPAQDFPGGPQFADAALAIGPSGAVQVAYIGGRSSLRVTQGTAGAPLPAPTSLSTGGKGTSSGPEVAAAFSADGTATVAWAKPGTRYEEGGPLEVFTRAPGGAFGAAQTLTNAAQGIAMAGGPGSSAALAWMTQDDRWTVHAALRSAATFDSPTRISDPSKNALWPTIAMTPAGEAIAAWVTNTDGSGSGEPTAAISN